MTKDEFIFELIDQCMYLACLDNIMVENFELRDDTQFYVQIEKQFYLCINFYEEMVDLCCKSRISEQTLNEELREVLALMNQKLLQQLFDDFVVYLDAAKLSPEKKVSGIKKIKSELIEKVVDTEFLLNKIQEFRKLEQESLV